jgi:hypothetical protein
MVRLTLKPYTTSLPYLSGAASLKPCPSYDDHSILQNWA